jgi:hypothetical protein
MEFTIQYFAAFDAMVYMERVEADEMVDALERARAVIKQPPELEGDPQPIGYVILDSRGRQVARGYSRHL